MALGMPNRVVSFKWRIICWHNRRQFECFIYGHFNGTYGYGVDCAIVDVVQMNVYAVEIDVHFARMDPQESLQMYCIWLVLRFIAL